MNRKEYRKQLLWRVCIPGLITCVLFIATIATSSLVGAVLTTATLGLAFTNLFKVDGLEKTDD